MGRMRSMMIKVGKTLLVLLCGALAAWGSSALMRWLFSGEDPLSTPSVIFGVVVAVAATVALRPWRSDVKLFRRDT